jgi:hypothetical protein
MAYVRRQQGTAYCTFVFADAFTQNNNWETWGRGSENSKRILLSTKTNAAFQDFLILGKVRH